MPIHDWTRVDAGLFHDFHQDWTIELRRTLNAGRLPSGYVALTDVPPQARFVIEAEEDTYARRANRIRIQHRHGEVVAVIEIVSPGHKSSRHALRRGLVGIVRRIEERVGNPLERDAHFLLTPLLQARLRSSPCRTLTSSGLRKSLLILRNTIFRPMILSR
jgi:hypothetical protein